MVSARWEGTVIRAAVENLAVEFAFLTDASLLNDSGPEFPTWPRLVVGIANGIDRAPVSCWG